jgi:catechol 2,3-dioxygenase-like lactoylglutathione lyase family enzyme
MTGTAPHAVAHVGITVPDLDAAIVWYGDLFGLRLIAPPADVDQAVESPFSGPVRDIFGSGLQRMRMAFLSSANACIVELFEFDQPAYEAPVEAFPYWRGGITHFAFVDPDVSGTAARIVERGGVQRSQVWTLFEGLPYQACYCQDPWGTVIEILSHSHEQTFANLGATPH